MATNMPSLTTDRDVFNKSGRKSDAYAFPAGPLSQRRRSEGKTYPSRRSQGFGRAGQFGRSTPSITWMTPFDWLTSAIVIFAL